MRSLKKKAVTLAETDWALRCSLASLTNRHGAAVRMAPIADMEARL